MYLPEAFLSRMRTQLGEGYADYCRAMREPPTRGLRVNTLKADVERFMDLSPFEMTRISEDGFVLNRPYAHIGNHPYHMAGLFYLQDPSAMRAVPLLDVKGGMRVLDLCAAPGGKAGQIAARLNHTGLLVANEVVPSRANVLKYTFERLGVTNALVTCMRPDALCEHLEAYFDAVLVDAPCSGEGMFRKDETAVREWSPEHVAACAKRQREILKCAARLLTPGGTLVYATCTFAPEENEAVLDAFTAAHPDFTLTSFVRLYPHTCDGEGHTMARLTKRGELRPHNDNCEKRASLDAFDAFVRSDMTCAPRGIPFVRADGNLMLLPEELPEHWNRLRIVGAGVHAGAIKNGRFQPAHALYMAYPDGFVRNVALDDAQMEAYFLGNTLELPRDFRGYCAVKAMGVTIGYGKAVDGTLKNHLPKGLRLAHKGMLYRGEV